MTKVAIWIRWPFGFWWQIWHLDQGGRCDKGGCFNNVDRFDLGTCFDQGGHLALVFQEGGNFDQGGCLDRDGLFAEVWSFNKFDRFDQGTFLDQGGHLD